MIRCEPLRSYALRLASGKWDFAISERRTIDAHWLELAAANPRLWNGEVLICTGVVIHDGRLTAQLLATDFASFIAWRDWGWPDRSVRNCFGVPAVMSRDGALEMGVMAASTLNAGRTYPPSGSLEPADAGADGCIDVRRSMALELLEETGLDLEAARPGATMAIYDGQRLAIVQRHDFGLSLVEMMWVFESHRASQQNPELDAILGIRSRSQIDSTMPGYAQEIVRQFFDK